MQHIIDQVWNQYDYDHNGTLDHAESHDFFRVVLEMNEQVLSTLLSRSARKISEEQIEIAVQECDSDNDGLISKDEMKKWISSHTKNNFQLKSETKEAIKRVKTRRASPLGAKEMISPFQAVEKEAAGAQTETDYDNQAQQYVDEMWENI